jgi:hypothetical protein
MNCPRSCGRSPRTEAVAASAAERAEAYPIGGWRMSFAGRRFCGQHGTSSRRGGKHVARSDDPCRGPVARASRGRGDGRVCGDGCGDYFGELGRDEAGWCRRSNGVPSLSPTDGAAVASARTACWWRGRAHTTGGGSVRGGPGAPDPVGAQDGGHSSGDNLGQLGRRLPCSRGADRVTACVPDVRCSRSRPVGAMRDMPPYPWQQHALRQMPEDALPIGRGP